MKEVRWKQRFMNFEKAFFLLQETDNLDIPSNIIKELTVKRFELTYELVWKVMKDFLEFQGVEKKIIGSRDAIRHSFQNEMITDGETWMELMKSRNKNTHNYFNEEILDAEYKKIKTAYFPLLKAFYEKIKTRL